MANFTWGLGRRKTAVARVRICAGSGKCLINSKPAADYFNSKTSEENSELPLSILGVSDKYDVYANVNGGGKMAQSGAVLLGLSRALIKENAEYEAKLRENGFLTRDPRMKERKKPGQKGARAKFQFSKR